MFILGGRIKVNYLQIWLIGWICRNRSIRECDLPRNFNDIINVMITNYEKTERSIFWKTFEWDKVFTVLRLAFVYILFTRWWIMLVLVTSYQCSYICNYGSMCMSLKQRQQEKYTTRRNEELAKNCKVLLEISFCYFGVWKIWKIAWFLHSNDTKIQVLYEENLWLG